MLQKVKCCRCKHKNSGTIGAKMEKLKGQREVCGECGERVHISAHPDLGLSVRECRKFLHWVPEQSPSWNEFYAYLWSERNHLDTYVLQFLIHSIFVFVNTSSIFQHFPNCIRLSATLKWRSTWVSNTYNGRNQLIKYLSAVTTRYKSLQLSAAGRTRLHGDRSLVPCQDLRTYPSQN